MTPAKFTIRHNWGWIQVIIDDGLPETDKYILHYLRVNCVQGMSVKHEIEYQPEIKDV